MKENSFGISFLNVVARLKNVTPLFVKSSMMICGKTYRWDIFCQCGRTAQRRPAAISEKYDVEMQNIPMGCLIDIRLDVSDVCLFVFRDYYHPDFVDFRI